MSEKRILAKLKFRNKNREIESVVLYSDTNKRNYHIECSRSYKNSNHCFFFYYDSFKDAFEKLIEIIKNKDNFLIEKKFYTENMNSFVKEKFSVSDFS